MSKLPLLSSNDFIKYISKKGFTHKHSKGSHHVYELGSLRITVPERDTLGKGLLLSMLAEIGIKREDFIREWNSKK